MNIKEWSDETVIKLKNFSRGGWTERTYLLAVGFLGEEMVRRFLKKRLISFMQVDLLFKHRDFITENNPHGYVVAEVKRQSRFAAGPNMPNPFDGHGLPPWQLQSRLKLGEELGVEPMLFVFEPNNNETFYWQKMTTLNALPDEEKFKTTTNPRVIFPIERFNEVPISNYTH